MHVWMKRGLRTALLTGGLLAAGSGIASADGRIQLRLPANGFVVLQRQIA